MRWSEEILLLQEEMSRTGAFLEWQSKWWETRQMLHTELRPAEEEGMRAYALRQASLRRRLREAFQLKWAGVSSLLSSTSRHPEVSAALFD
jgi:hypothetical protein